MGKTGSAEEEGTVTHPINSCPEAGMTGACLGETKQRTSLDEW